MVYAIPLALLCHLLPFDLHGLSSSLHLSRYLPMPFVGVAMIALGVQINRTPLNFFKMDVMLTTTLRLIVKPTYSSWYYHTIYNVLRVHASNSAQTIVITYSVPTAINMALIAIEMKNNPEYATQIR